MSEAWDDEGFGGENDWGAESVETDLEEDALFEPVDVEEHDDDHDSDDDQ
jgi:hypothetical protein